MADNRLASFARKFGRAHRYLAYHAAFPVALTPDMVYQIWNNFRQDVRGNLLNIPWVAVADLLLSNLCDEVGHELYQIDGVVRDLLLDELEADPRFGLERVMTLAKFLEDYVAHAMNLGETAPPDEQMLAQAQSWTALAYREPGETAVSLTEKLQALDWNNERDLLEIGRISRLMQSFGKPLVEAGQENLLTYAQVAQEIAAGNWDKAVAIGQSTNLGAAVAIAGKQLQLPTALTERLRQTPPIPGTSVSEPALEMPHPVGSDPVNLRLELPSGADIFTSMSKITGVPNDIGTDQLSSAEYPIYMPLITGEQYQLWVSIGNGDFVALDSFGTSPPTVNIQVALFSLDDDLQFDKTQAVIDLTEEMDIRLQKSVPTNPTLSGSSVYFSLHAPKKPGTYRFRCNLYYEQLLLQSRLVELVVSDQPVEQPEPQFRVTLDYDLGQPWTAAAITRLGSRVMSLFVSRELVCLFAEKDVKGQMPWREGEWQNMVEASRRSLRQTAWGHDGPYHPGASYRYAGRPAPEQLREDLVRMALHGYNLYDGVINQLLSRSPDNWYLLGGLLNAEQVDLPLVPDIIEQEIKQETVAARNIEIALMPNTLAQPFTTIYDYPLDTGLKPDDLSLCPTFLEALERELPLAECECFQGRCPSFRDEQVVCPSGFWGFRHAIGLPLPVGGAGAAGTVAIGDQTRLCLHLSTDPNLSHLAKHQAMLAGMMSGGVETAVSRQESLDLMAQNKAQVVYFYCHAGVVQDRPYVQVGSPTEKGMTRSNLLASRIHWTLPRPLVFLNAVNATAAFTPEASRDLLTGFMETAGAAGLVSAEMTVFEPAATTFAEEFMRLFMVDRLPAGEAIRLSRLHLLGQGNPLGLVYNLYALPSLMLVYDDRLVNAETAVTDSVSTEPAQPQTLVGALIDMFSFDELALLAYELGIDVDALMGVDKQAKIETLLAQLDEESRHDQLLAVAAQMRPDFDWQQFGSLGTAPSGPFLYRAIDQLFNKDELTLLCLDMGIEYESLPGQTIIRKAMELVEACEREDRIETLLLHLRRQNPSMDLSSFTPLQANGRFLTDVTIPDDTHLVAGQTFTKTWLVENSGSVSWGEGFQLVHVEGELLAAEMVYPLPTAVPGEKVEISIPMTAPAQPGSYFNDWRFQDDQGNLFGDIVFVRIVVEGETAVSQLKSIDPELIRRELRQMINNNFNLDELQMLCFDLNIAYDDLQGKSKPEKIRELIIYCERRELLPELVRLCQELRPNADWPVFETAVSQPEPAEPAYNLRELSQIIDKLFDLQELKMLCFDLAIDYDELLGKSKREKIYELINYCERRDRLSELVGKLEKAAETYEQAGEWQKAADMWQQLDRDGKRADALERYAQSLTNQEIDEETVATAWERAARVHAGLGQREARQRCEREAARYRHLPILVIEIEVKDLVIHQWSKLDFVVKNDGFGPARYVIVNLVDDLFVGRAKHSDMKVTVMPNKKLANWLEVQPKVQGDDVPMQLLVEYVDRTGNNKTLERTFYLPVIGEDDIPTGSRESARLELPDGRDPMALRKNMIAYFSAEELDILIFDLGGRTDDFSSNKSVKAREIITWAVQQNQVNNLIVYCQKERPGVEW